MHRLAIVLTALIALAQPLLAESPYTGQPDPRPKSKAIDYTDACILGIIEGITEFLPVSSTGHLILVGHYLGLDQGAPLTRRDGSFIYHKKEPDIPYTLKEAVDAYLVFIQGGAILAVILLYGAKLWSVVLGLFGKSPKGFLLGRNLIAAFIPAAVAGFLLEHWIDKYLFNPPCVIFATIAGAGLILIFEQWRKQHQAAQGAAMVQALHAMTVKQSLWIGLLQCFALWPGASRSMMAMIGALSIGLPTILAAEFSFLLGFVTLGAASAYKGLSLGRLLLDGLPWGPMAAGFGVSTVCAFFAIKGLVSFLTGYGLAVFAYYRIALGVVLIFLLRHSF